MDSYPETTATGSFLADFIDTPGWMYNETKQVLNFRPYQVQGSVVGYIGVYVSPGTTAHYGLTLSSSSSQLCPRQCSTHGTCRFSVCQCELGYQGSDCRLKASVLSESGVLALSVGTGVWSLATLQLQSRSFESAVNLRFTSESISSNVLIWAKTGLGDEATFPTSLNYGSTTKLTESGLVILTVPYSTQDLALHVAIYNSGPDDVQLEVEPQYVGRYVVNTSGALVISLTLSLGAVVFGVAAGFFFFYLKRRKSHIRKKTMQKGISMQRVEAFFPIKTLGEIQEMRLPDRCDMCEDQFSAESKTRVLPCNHVFHTSCIDFWFASHSTCVICDHDCLKLLADQAAERRKRDASDGTAERPGTVQQMDESTIVQSEKLSLSNTVEIEGNFQ